MTDRAKLEAARSRGFPEALREQIAAWDQLRSGCRSAHDLIRDVHAWLASQPADETEALRARVKDLEAERTEIVSAIASFSPERTKGQTLVDGIRTIATDLSTTLGYVAKITDERDSARAKAIGSKEMCAMGDWIKTLRRRRINDTRPFAWIDVDITQRSILDAMRDEPSLKDAEAIRWIRKGKCIGTTSPQRFGSEIYDGDDVDALLARITELESELATLRNDAALGRAVRNSGVTLDWLTERGRELRNSRGSLALSSVAYADAHAQEIALVDAITSALREEER